MTRFLTLIAMLAIISTQTTAAQINDRQTSDHIRLAGKRQSAEENKMPLAIPIPTMLPTHTKVDESTGTTIISYSYLSQLITHRLELTTSETEKLVRLERKHKPDINGRKALEAAMRDFRDELPTEKQNRLRQVLIKLPMPIDLFRDKNKYADAPYESLPEKLAAPLSLSPTQIKYCDMLIRRYAPQFSGEQGFLRAMKEFSRGISPEQRKLLPEALANISDKFPPVTPVLN